MYQRRVDIVRGSIRITRKSYGMSYFVFDRRCRHHFGIIPQLASRVWENLSASLPMRDSYDRLLWALLFLNCYDTSVVHYLSPMRRC